MYSKVVVAIVAFVVILQNIESVSSVGHSADLVGIVYPNNTNWSKLILVAGNCNNVWPQNIVANKTTELKAVPLYRRDSKVEWHGDQTVVCITVFQLKDNGHPGDIKISDGGVGHKYVTITMESDRGHGLHLQTYVYAQWK